MSTPELATRRRIPRWVVPALAYILSLLCLIRVYRGFDWKEQLEWLSSTNWSWVAASVAVSIVVYFCQGWRWSVLLTPLERISWLKSSQAVFIGLLANELLPLRSGELIRCYLQKRWSELPISVLISSAIIERMLDGIWLIVGFSLTSRFVELPRRMVAGSRVVVLALMVMAGLVAMAALYKGHASEMVSKSRWGSGLAHVVDGVHSMGRSRSFLDAALISLLFLVIQVFPIYFMFRAVGLELGLWSACLVLVVLRFGTIVPAAPGNLGLFHFMVTIALQLLDVSRADATQFANLLFVVVTVPLLVAGFVALLTTGMRLGEIHTAAHEHFSAERR